MYWRLQNFDAAEIVAIDTETTGIGYGSEVIEIGAAKIDIATGETEETLMSSLCRILSVTVRAICRRKSLNSLALPIKCWTSTALRCMMQSICWTTLLAIAQSCSTTQCLTDAIHLSGIRADEQDHFQRIRGL